MQKVLVAGSRTFRDYERLAECLRALKAEIGPFHLIHGGAPGADLLADEWARKNATSTTVYRPEWQRHGRGAGPIRNRVMVDIADQVIVFWDGNSPGTRSTIDIARRAGKPVRLEPFTPDGR